MDPTTDLATATTISPTPAVASEPRPALTRGGSSHPLIWAALLVWLSIEAIGDGLLALQTVLTSATADRSNTPTVTPS